MLVLKPVGRGNWAKTYLNVSGAHLPWLTVAAGLLALAAGFAAGFATCAGRHYIRDGRAMVLAFCDLLQQGARRG